MFKQIHLIYFFKTFGYCHKLKCYLITHCNTQTYNGSTTNYRIINELPTNFIIYNNILIMIFSHYIEKYIRYSNYFSKTSIHFTTFTKLNIF